MTAATTTPEPATGRVRWLPDDSITGDAWLRITTHTKAGPVVQDYEVEEVKPGVYRLWRLDTQTFNLVCYTVRVGSWQPTCDCPDSQHRRAGACKHVRGLQAALDALPF